MAVCVLPEDMAQLDDLLRDGEGGLLVEPLEAAVAQDAPLHLQMVFLNAEVSGRVADPYSYDTDLDPAFKAEYQAGSRCFNDQKLKKFTAEKKIIFLWIKKHNLPIPRHLQRKSKLQKKPSAAKREHPALQNMKFLNYFLLLWVIFALLDPDPDSEYGSGSTDSIESGFNPDPQPWFMSINSCLLDLEFLSGFPPSFFRSTNCYSWIDSSFAPVFFFPGFFCKDF